MRYINEHTFSVRCRRAISAVRQLETSPENPITKRELVFEERCAVAAIVRVSRAVSSLKPTLDRCTFGVAGKPPTLVTVLQASSAQRDAQERRAVRIPAVSRDELHPR